MSSTTIPVLFLFNLSGLESRLLNRFDVQRYAREAYNMGIRYIGACCGMEPYHVRAIAEEASVILFHSIAVDEFRFLRRTMLHLCSRLISFPDLAGGRVYTRDLGRRFRADDEEF